jgi:hypothetical protein
MSGHEVRKWLEGQKTSGKIKACAHLRVLSVTQGNRCAFFVPSCHMRSFEWKYPPIDLRQETELLISLLHENVISCPADCLNYRSVWRERLARTWVKARGFVIGAAKWFDSQSWQVKLGAIALAIVVLTPKWVPLIVQLLNAYHGK